MSTHPLHEQFREQLRTAYAESCQVLATFLNIRPGSVDRLRPGWRKRTWVFCDRLERSVDTHLFTPTATTTPTTATSTVPTAALRLTGRLGFDHRRGTASCRLRRMPPKLGNDGIKRERIFDQRLGSRRAGSQIAHHRGPELLAATSLSSFLVATTTATFMRAHHPRHDGRARTLS